MRESEREKRRKGERGGKDREVERGWRGREREGKRKGGREYQYEFQSKYSS